MKRSLGLGLVGMLVATVAGRAEAEEAAPPDALVADSMPETLHVGDTVWAPRVEPIAPEKPATSFRDRPFFVGPRMGYGTTTGIIGVVAEYTVVDPVALGISLGVNSKGLEYSAHMRFRVATWTARSGRLHAFTLEPAYSLARYASEMQLNFCQGDAPDPENPCYGPQRANSWVSWAALEAGWETRSDSGFTVAVAMGAAHLLGRDPRCVLKGGPVPCGYGHDTADRWLPTLSVTFGQTF